MATCIVLHPGQMMSYETEGWRVWASQALSGYTVRAARLKPHGSKATLAGGLNKKTGRCLAKSCSTPWFRTKTWDEAVALLEALVEALEDA